jgi:hypothetical protein
MLFSAVYIEADPRRYCSTPDALVSAPESPLSNANGVTSLPARHQLNVIKSIRYEKHRGKSPKVTRLSCFRFSDRSLFFSYCYALFCVRRKLNPLVFMRFHTLCEKHPEVGVPRHSPSLCQSSLRSIARNLPWCNNEPWRENLSPSGETTPPPPVSKDSKRTPRTHRWRSRFYPDLVGAES